MEMQRKFSLEYVKTDVRYVEQGLNAHALLFSIVKPFKGLRILEPGCGSGKLGIAYARLGCFVTLLDFDAEAVEYARKVAGYFPEALPTLEFRIGSIHRLPVDWTNTFDFVFNEGVPQHWGYNRHDWRRQRSINEMVRVAKPGGYICVIANNADCPEIVEMARSVSHDYKGMPARELPFTQAELAVRLYKAGIKNPQTSVVRDDPRLSVPRLIAGWGTKR